MVLSRDEEPLPLPEGWFYERVGSVLVRTKPPEHLSFDELVSREVASSVALGDDRPAEEVEADVRSELAFRIHRYLRSSVPGL